MDPEPRPGAVAAPLHMLCSRISLVELYAKWPGLVTPREVAGLIKSGQIVYDAGQKKYVPKPQPVETVAARKTSGRRKR